jgi:hypothetical protein
MTFGGELAPQLVLVTKGPSAVSFGVENPERYSNVVIVQHNARKQFVSIENAGVDQFGTSDLAKALKSQSLFFITARQAGTGRYVSSRYERIDLDMILTKIGAACPFDAESLMADLRPRLRAERALSLSAGG